MPITYDYIEPFIYRTCWIGVIHISEPFDELPHLMALVTDHGDDHYILIMDLTDTTQIPFDLSNLSRIAKTDSRIQAYVVVHASKIAEIMGKMVNQVTKRPMHFVSSMTQGIELAHTLLQNFAESTAL